jgi:hypothetical protein
VHSNRLAETGVKLPLEACTCSRSLSLVRVILNHSISVRTSRVVIVQRSPSSVLLL